MSDTEEEEEDESQRSASTRPAAKKSRASLGNAKTVDLSDDDGATPKKRKRASAVSAKPIKSDRVMLESDDGAFASA
jgi:hypothetical protein